jgi:hypothetical protein
LISAVLASIEQERDEVVDRSSVCQRHAEVRGAIDFTNASRSSQSL